MISRALQRLPLAAVLLAALAVASCEKVPLLAPSGSTLTLTASTTALPANGTTQIIAQLIEPSGTPPHSGTQITFTTSLGTIEPSEVETDVNGRATTTFKAGNANGTANITALSGGVSTGTNGALKIAVGSAAVGRVNVSATPSTVPALGGTSTITANVLDINGNVLSSVPVTFTTTAGSLTASTVATDANGNAQTILQTSQQTTVTASVGAQGGGTGTGGGTGSGGGTGGTGSGTTTPPVSGQSSGSVTVTVSPAPTVVITPPTTPPSEGLPASFTFAVTVPQGGSAVRDLIVHWGDGQTQDLGAVNGNAIVAHVYHSAGTYVIEATVTDSFGNSSTVSTAVTVIPVPRPTIILAATPGQPGTRTANLTITITAPAGIGIVSVTVNWGDNTQPQDLGGATGTITGLSHPYDTAGLKHISVTVVDTTGTATTGTVDVTVS